MIHSSWKITEPSNKNIAAMLSYSPEYYEKRLKKIGFIGKDKKLLDSGCGAGHWSLVASKKFKKVYGIDSTEKYLNVAREIKSKLKIKNSEFKIGRMEKLPFKDNSFDFVISYCAWMYTKRPESLKELSRVLKPHGKVYLGAVAGFGWYLKLTWQAVLEGDRNLFVESLKAIKNRVYTNESETRKLLNKNNLRIIGLGSDASLGNPEIVIKPIYDAKILGFWNVYEVLAVKKDVNNRDSRVINSDSSSEE